MKTTFWGVRGSIPSPLTPQQVEDKVRRAFEAAERGDSFDMLNFDERATFGGNTTCVEVDVEGSQFIFDMGTGVRELGKSQIKSIMAKPPHERLLKGTILQSHVHWDHIQGLPFWAPMYLPRRQFGCFYEFFGGKTWDSKLDEVYRGQMDAPYFPVNLQELEESAMQMKFNTVYDGWMHSLVHDDDLLTVLARKLNHPQETFGYRLYYRDKTIAFTTDHEPFADGIPRGLAELVQGVDLWITDCQYTHDEFIGARGPQKMGWGHSFPEYIAKVAKEVKPKSIITTHHDPDADDKRIISIANAVQDMCQIDTKPAYEGLIVNV